MARRQNLALLATIALCVMATVAAQGPPETTLNMDNCGATLAGTVEVTGGLDELSRLIGNVSAQIPTLTATGKAVTLFAPSNSALGAFQAALSGAHPTMSQDKMKQLLAQMVRYHMLPQPLTTGNMTVGQVLKTSLTGGHNLKVTATSPQVKLEGAVSGSEARIGQPNIMICKSVMHIVDAVLLPAPIADLAAGKLAPASAATAAAPSSNATAAAAKPALPAKSAKPAKGKPAPITETTISKKTTTPTAAGAAKPKTSSTDASVAKSSASASSAGKAVSTTVKTPSSSSKKAAAAVVSSGAAPSGSISSVLCLVVAAVAATVMLG